MITTTRRSEPDTNPIQVARFIREIQTRLAKPAQWTKDALCRNSDGDEALIADIDLVSFCLHGGMERTYLEWSEYRDMEKEELDRILDAVGENLLDSVDDFHPQRYESIAHYNDDCRTTHSDILRTLEFSDTLGSVGAWGMVQQPGSD